MIHLLHEGRVLIFEDVICQNPGHRHFYWKLKKLQKLWYADHKMPVYYYCLVQYMEYLPVFSFQVSFPDRIPCTKIEKGRNKIAEFLK